LSGIEQYQKQMINRIRDISNTTN